MSSNPNIVNTDDSTELIVPLIRHLIDRHSDTSDFRLSPEIVSILWDVIWKFTSGK